MSLEVLAPTAAGTYQLALDMVQEGVCWFADKGSESYRSRVVVRPDTAIDSHPQSPENVDASSTLEPIMEMYGSTEVEVSDWVVGADGRILSVFDWDSIFESISLDWQRRGYVVMRNRGPADRWRAKRTQMRMASNPA